MRNARQARLREELARAGPHVVVWCDDRVVPYKARGRECEANPPQFRTQAM